MKIPREDPAGLYARHVAEHTDAMRLAAAVSRADFDSIYTPHLMRLCRALQRAPLSRQGYPLPDGAVRFATHCATLALQIAQASIFSPDGGAVLRRRLEPQYRFAVFAAAIGAAYIGVFRNVRFSVGGVAWNPLSETTLFDFCAASGEYEIAWAADGEIEPSAPLDAMVFMAAFPHGFWERFSPLVLQDLSRSLSPAKNAVSESPMQRLLREATEKTVEREALRIAQNVEAMAGIAVASRHPDLDASQATVQPEGTAAKPADPPRTAYSLPVRQFFAAMGKDEKADEIRKDIEITGDGVAVPLKCLGRYGQSATDAARMLESAGLVISKNSKHLILRPEVAGLLPIGKA